nr:transcription repressor OFP15-like [Ipomoea trifida]
MKLIPFLSKSSESTWPWQCGVSSPRTLSFRADDATAVFAADHYSSSSPDDDSVEKVIKGLRSERLFFEPGHTSSKLDEAAATAAAAEESPLKESVAMAVESTDPFLDFRRSMEEMVAAHHNHGREDKIEEVLDWEFLEELLTCYLKINGKTNHGYIVGAFVDLLVSLSAHSSSHHHHHHHPATHEKSPAAGAGAAVIIPPSSSPSSSTSSDENCLLSCTNSHSFTSPLSFCSSTCSTSPCLSFPQEAQDRD